MRLLIYKRGKVMNLEFEYNDKHYHIELSNLKTEKTSSYYPPNLDYSIALALEDDQELPENWEPDYEFEQHLANMIYDRL